MVRKFSHRKIYFDQVGLQQYRSNQDVHGPFPSIWCFVY